MFDFIEKEIRNSHLEVYGIEIHKNNKLIYNHFFEENKVYL